MIRVRCGRGFGDSLYLRPIVDHLVRRGEQVTALSNYPDIFIGSGATVERFTRATSCLVANYTHDMASERSQFASMLKSARLPADVPLRFAWQVRNDDLVQTVRANAEGRHVILVHGGRMPMQRGDTWAAPLMPKLAAFQSVLHELSHCYLVRIGDDHKPAPLPVHLDLNRKTTISDVLDLASTCDGVVAQCSFAVPLAECFDKPLLTIWSRCGLNSSDSYLPLVRPQKVLSKPSSSFVIDDWPNVAGAARTWSQVVACGCQQMEHSLT